MMKLLLITGLLQFYGIVLCKNKTSNSSDTSKDMYVIHAMVYQVGILTNKTDDKAYNTTMGNQEALTFFRTNGSKVDLSGIPAPILTNVTAQSMVQVAPKTGVQEKPQIPWSALKHLASLPQSSTPIQTDNRGTKITRRDTSPDVDENYYDETPQEAYKRSLNEMKKTFKRATSDDKPDVKVVKGAAVIPRDAGVQSIAIPPLLALNNNLSDIPVPIPNTSLVHYAKINTLIRKP